MTANFIIIILTIIFFTIQQFLFFFTFLISTVGLEQRVTGVVPEVLKPGGATRPPAASVRKEKARYARLRFPWLDKQRTRNEKGEASPPPPPPPETLVFQREDSKYLNASRVPALSTLY